MCRSTILKTGAIAYRTKLMLASRAEQFAKCLRANSRFTEVSVEFSDRSKGDKSHFVIYQPTNDERQKDLYEAQWNQRLIKGWTEGMEYEFVQDCDHLGAWWCLSTSGETYCVGSHGCDCPDYVYRCRRAGLHCKHLHALEAQRENQTLGKKMIVTAAAYAA